MISVVTITFNNFEDLQRTLASIQSLSGVESVVINGGTCERTAEFLKGHKSVRALSEPDRGISDAFNKGALLSQGIGVAFLNSGDTYIGGDYYSAVKRILEESPDIDFVHSTISFADQVVGTTVLKPLRGNLGMGIPMLHPTLVVRRSVFDRIGYFDLEKKFAMDFDFECRMLKQGMQGVYLAREPVVFMDGTGVSVKNAGKSIIETWHSMRKHGVIGGKTLLGFGCRLSFHYLTRALRALGLSSVLKKIRRAAYSFSQAGG